MKFASCEILKNGIRGICKQAALWGTTAGTDRMAPLIYFRKPKWINEEDFQRVLEGIRWEVEKGFEIQKEIKG